MRFAVLVVALLAAVASASAAERDRSVAAGGLSRKYTLITPEIVPTPLPLIVVYHGGRQSASWARRYTRFDEWATKLNIAVVYPQGLDNNWNDGRMSGDLSRRAALNADDVEFTVQIVAQLEAEGIVDPSRVFLTGASNGGMMALRAGCELGDKIAGIAVVVANQPADWTCRTEKLAALFINGTDDEYMPFEGGRVAATKTRRDLSRVLSVDETIEAFKRINTCSGVKETKTLDKVGRDDTTAIVTDYECSEAPLKQIVIKGGGHTWPGARDGIVSDLLLGNTSEELSATAEIWNFFNALPKR